MEALITGVALIVGFVVVDALRVAVTTIARWASVIAVGVTVGESARLYGANAQEIATSVLVAAVVIRWWRSRAAGE